MTKAERQSKLCHICGKRESEHPGGQFCRKGKPLHSAWYSQAMTDANRDIKSAVEHLADANWGDISLENAETYLRQALNHIAIMRDMV